MHKKIYKIVDVKDRIYKVIDEHVGPVASTMGPKGGNVLCESDTGDVFFSNDGAAIFGLASPRGDVENVIIELIKRGARETNNLAGDGSSTTINLTGISIKEGVKLLADEGWNPIRLKEEFLAFGEHLQTNLNKLVKKVKSDADLKNIALISSSGDTNIATDIVKVAKKAGQDGLVFLVPNNVPETEIVEDTGFNIDSGMFDQELSNSKNGFSATYLDIPVFITDKRIYHSAEAETILKTVLQAGYKEVVVVARDFIGEALPYFMANHKEKNIRVLLIKDGAAKDGDATTLEDLAVYLKGEVVSDKSGSIVDNITIDNFVMAKKVYADMSKAIISRDKKERNTELTYRISALRNEMSKLKEAESEPLKKRIAALTNGIITIKVGGHTTRQIREKIFKYEDALNATRSAMKDGYLVGGGVSLYRALSKKYEGKNGLSNFFRKFTQSNIRQIAENHAENADLILKEIEQSKNNNVGYNAATGKVEDLLKAGVIDPYRVTKMAINNSILTAMAIISSNYMIINDLENEEDNTKKKNGKTRD